MRRRRSSLLSAGLLVTVALTAGHDEAGATQSVTVIRHSGPTRYATAAEVATATYQPAGTPGAVGVRPRPDVIVASGENFPDGLAAAGLAGHLDAPVLLTQRDTLPAETAAALGTLVASRVHVMGGTSAISQAVRDQISALGYTLVTNYAGVNRYDTSARIATAIGAANVGGLNGKRTAFVVVGTNFADALATGAPAFAGRHPILLTESASLPPETSLALTTLGIQHVVIVGGTTAVGQGVADAVAAKGMTVSRIAGTDRAATARLLANLTVTAVGSGGFGFPAAGVVLYNGFDGFADGLAAGPMAGKLRFPLVPVDDASVPTASSTFLNANKATISRIEVVGGTAAISDTTATAVKSTATTGTPVATIAAFHGGTTFTVSFSEAINPATLTADDFSITSAAPAETSGAVTAVPGTGNTRFSVAVNGSGLDPGDVVSLIDGVPADSLAEVTSVSGGKVSTAATVVVTDTTAPLVTFTANAGSGGAGTGILVTISEPVTGFTAADVTLDGAPLAALFGTSPGPFYLTPGGLTAGRVVAVAAAAFTDLAGNPVAATSQTVGTDSLSPSLSSAVAEITRSGTDSLGVLQGLSTLIVTARTTGYTGLTFSITAGAGNSQPTLLYNSATKAIAVTLGITPGNNSPAAIAQLINTSTAVNGLVSATGIGTPDLSPAASAALTGGSTTGAITVTFSEAMLGNAAGALAVDIDGNLATFGDRFTEAGGYTASPSGLFTVNTVNPGAVVLSNALAPIPGTSKLIIDTAFSDFAGNQAPAGTVVTIA